MCGCESGPGNERKQMSLDGPFRKTLLGQSGAWSVFSDGETAAR
ncbi:unnamed protein product [Gulo gulo]|uniref:Uncharacterized protein n=1 Tax=Gulo gulo TaxID=48420 RepID=A0A9X9LWD8_GULGU|nr:unnamed protein product [Gulo gulo]